MMFSAQAPSAIFLIPESLDDIKTGVWRIHDSCVIFFDISNLDTPTYVRALDYLRGYVDCCHARMAMMSKDLLMVAPTDVDISSEEILEIYHDWEQHI